MANEKCSYCNEGYIYVDNDGVTKCTNPNCSYEEVPLQPTNKG